jgi:hypothetical protein
VIAMKGARVVTVSNLATLQDWSERNQG